MGLPGTHLLVGIILLSIHLTVTSCTRKTHSRALWYVVLCWLVFCPYLAPLLYPTESQEDEVHFFTTADGARINLSRYRAHNSTLGVRKQSFTAPVILCHGAFANRHTYDLGKGRTSLAKYLSDRGHDVWVLELRAHGRSTKPGWIPSVLSQGMNAEGSWSVIKYIEQDLPAAIDYVKRHTQATKIHWVGHSMGGIILYSWLAFHMQNARDFASIVTLGSSLDHPRKSSQPEKAPAAGTGPGEKNMTSAYHFLYVPRGLRSPGLAPFSWANSIFAPLGGGLFDMFNGFQYNSGMASKAEDIKVLLANNFESEPWQVVFDIHTVFSKKLGMLHPVTKEPLLPQLNHSLPVPLLAFAGECDMQFKPEAVSRTAHHLAAKDTDRFVRYITAGKDEGVCYGHYDLLIGQRADRDVFQPLEQWIVEVDQGQHWYDEGAYDAACKAPPQADSVPADAAVSDAAPGGGGDATAA